MRHLAVVAAACCSLLNGSAAFGAEAFPVRPVRIVVGFDTGGATDIASRIVGAKMGDVLGQPVIIDSRPGASTTLAGDVVAKSAPDGYTLFVAGNASAANVVTQTRVPFDIVQDFTPVGIAVTAPSVLVVDPKRGIHTVPELVTEAKAAPGHILYASAGLGAVSHVAGAFFALKTGTQLTHVPFKGSSQAIVDVIGGRIQIMFSPIPTALPFIQNGKLVPLAVTSRDRLPSLPDVPTFAEVGLTGFEPAIWFGLVAPKGTPSDRIAVLREALHTTLQDADVKSQLASQGMSPVDSDGAAFTRRMTSDIAMMRQIGQTAEPKNN